MSKTQKPCFLILGVARSGTTLLERLLTNHSQIAVCPESDVFSSIYRTTWRGRFVSNGHYRQFMTYLQGWLKEFNDPAVEVVREYQQENQTYKGTAEVLLKNLVSEYVEREGKIIFGEKSPKNTYYVHLIASLFPAIKLVRIIRHPFDVACSIAKLLDRDPGISSSREENLLRAAIFIRIGAQSLSCRPLSNSQDYQLKYENLIENPAEELTKICNFLEVDFEEQMLNIDAENYFTNAEKKAVVHPNLGKKINANNKNKYLTELTASQQQLLFRFLGSQLANLPYQITDNKAKLKPAEYWLLKKHQLLYKLKHHFWQDEIIRLKLLVKHLIFSSKKADK